MNKGRDRAVGSAKEQPVGQLANTVDLSAGWRTTVKVTLAEKEGLQKKRRRGIQINVRDRGPPRK